MHLIYLHDLPMKTFANEGMDITDIERVVQYMVPSSLSVFVQQFGRAGRSGQPALTILLVKPSVFQTVRKKNSKKKKDVVIKVEDLDDAMVDSEAEGIETKYKKTVEDGLRHWVETIACRRSIINGYFNIPAILKRYILSHLI